MNLTVILRILQLLLKEKHCFTKSGFKISLEKCYLAFQEIRRQTMGQFHNKALKTASFNHCTDIYGEALM